MNQVLCPWCGEEVVLSGTICPSCRHEVLPEHLEGGGPEERGDDAEVDEREQRQGIEERLTESYVCGKCGHDACMVNEVAMTGTGLSKLMDIQYHHYLFVSCLRCGGVDIFDPNVLEKSRRGSFGSGLDVLF
ncbi:zinc ribbon domain-containing protein [Paenibacillus sp. PL2-23]|uniref:zinc ribbon domain-containing protein n=1 Tax=Paenibacillus sp. PL2-23 TaxID=2100729 RepID=UPI0030F89F35